MSHRNLLVLASLSFALVTSLGGCGSSSTDLKKLYGATFDLQVTAFGKTDTDTAIVGEGEKDLLIFDFTYGFYTNAGDSNEEGLQVSLKGDKLEVAQQPIHVDHSTGSIDGTVTGSGTLSGTTLTLTLNVLPNDFTVTDSSGNAEPAGTTVDYMLTGTEVPAS